MTKYQDEANSIDGYYDANEEHEIRAWERKRTHVDDWIEDVEDRLADEVGV